MPQYELVVLSEGSEKQRVPLNDEAIIIGRSAKADIVIDQKTVSRKHAKAWVEEGLVTVEDLGSRNGIGIGSDGERVRNASFRDGQSFSVGDVVFLVRDKNAVREEEPAPPPPREAPSRDGSVAGEQPSLAVCSALLQNATSPDDLVQKILNASLELVSGQRCFIFDRHSDTGDPRLWAFYSRYDNPDGGVLDRFIVEKVLPKNGKGEPPSAQWHHEEGTLCVHLKGERSHHGVLYVDTPKNGSDFGKKELKLLVTFAQLAGAALERMNSRR